MDSEPPAPCNRICDYVDYRTGTLLYSVPFLDTTGMREGRPYRPGDAYLAEVAPDVKPD